MMKVISLALIKKSFIIWSQPDALFVFSFLNTFFNSRSVKSVLISSLLLLLHSFAIFCLFFVSHFFFLIKFGGCFYCLSCLLLCSSELSGLLILILLFCLSNHLGIF